MLVPYEVADVGEARAIGFKVCIEPEPEPNTTIAVVRDRPDNFRVGKVLSMGTDAQKALPDLSVGDRVLYAQSVACTTALRDRHFVHHDHVLCIVDGPGALNPRATAPAAARIEGAAPRWSGEAGKWSRP